MSIGKISLYNYGLNNTIAKNNTSFKGRNNLNNKQKNATNPVKYESTYPARAIFMMAENDVKVPELIVEEFYANETNRLPNKHLGVSLSRFTPREKYEILQFADDIKIHKTGFSRIINARNEDSSYRFDALQALDLFFDAGKEIEKYPTEFKKIYSQKDSENKPRFNARDCALLMQYADLFKAYPNAFDSILALKSLNAEDCQNIMLKRGASIEDNPELLKEALELAPHNKGESNYGKKLDKTIKKLIKQKEEKLVQQQEEEKAAILEQRHEEARQAEEERKQNEEEKRLKAQIAAQKSAEKNALRLAEEKKIKQQKMEYWNDKVGWISPQELFNKVNKAVASDTHLTLENGEVLPDEMRDKIAYYIKKASNKSQKIINARYKNLQPIFNEKECCNILSDLDSYYYPESMTSLKSVREDGTPIFNAEQCKELLKLKQSYRDMVIRQYLFSTSRCFSPDDIVEIMKNSNAVFRHDSLFRELVFQKNENGQYRYSVKDCIEISQNELDRENEINKMLTI